MKIKIDENTENDNYSKGLSAEDQAVDELISEMGEIMEKNNPQQTGVKYFKSHMGIIALFVLYVIAFILLIIGERVGACSLYMEIVSWSMLVLGLAFECVILYKLIRGESVSRLAMNEVITEKELDELQKHIDKDIPESFRGNIAGLIGILGHRKALAADICDRNKELIIAAVSSIVTSLKPIADLEKMVTSNNTILSILGVAVCFVSLVAYIIKSEMYKNYWPVKNEVLLKALYLLNLRNN